MIIEPVFVVLSFTLDWAVYTTGGRGIFLIYPSAAGTV